MPGKVNPVIVESLTMVVARVIGNDATVGVRPDRQLPRAQRDAAGDRGGAPRVDRAARPPRRPTSAPGCVEGLAATDRGPALVEQGLMLATALAPVIGYDEAAKLAKEAFKSGRTIRELAARARDGSGRAGPAARPGGDDRARPRRRAGRRLRTPARGPATRRARPAGYNPRDDRDPPLGSRRRPARPVGRRPAARGRRAARRDCRPSPSCSTSCATPSCGSRPSGCGSRSDAWTARGEERHDDGRRPPSPGDAKVTTTQPGPAARAEYEIWISTARSSGPTASAHRSARSGRSGNRPRGLGDPDFPGTAKVYEPVTALPTETLPETFVHPGRATARTSWRPDACRSTGTDDVAGREAILVDCDHPRTIELPGDRPDFRIRSRSTARRASSSASIETIGGIVTRDAEVTELRARTSRSPPTAFDFVFPTGTTMLY